MHMPLVRLFVGASALALHTGALAQGLSPAPVGSPAIDQGVAPADPSANATTTPQAPTGASEGLGDIIVTAQRRDESLQDVPLSVQVFSATQLEAKGATSLNDLPNLVPGVTIVPLGVQSRVYIRGVGNSNAGASGTVITMIDGVYQPFLAGVPQFVGISGIEVDKGPQGTLFGRNATGGAIQISTRRPDSEPTFEAHVGYGNYDTISGDVYAGTALSDNVRANVSGYLSHRREGWGINRFNGEDIFTDKQYGARTKWDIDISDATSLEIIADYAYSRSNIGASASPDPAYGFLYNSVTASTYTLPGTYDVLANYGPTNTAEQGGVSAKIESEITDGIKLTSTSFWRKSRGEQLLDLDATGFPFADLNFVIARDALSQELQLASDKSGAFNWVAGVFYYHEETRVTSALSGILAGLPGFGSPGLPFVSVGDEVTDAIAGYGQASYEFLPGTTLTLGGRYTEDKRVVGGEIRLGGPSAPLVPGRAGSQSANFKKLTYRVALDHKVNDDLMLYASVSSGFNAGGFTAGSLAGYTSALNPRVDPEEITAYEVGFKSNFLDNRVRANVSAFWYDYANLQQSVFDVVMTTIINAGQARMKGVDFEFSARPIDNLTISLNGEYLDAKYRSYLRAPSYRFGAVGELGRFGQPVTGALILESLAANNGGVGAAGKRVTNAPMWSLNPDITYVIPTEVGDFATSASLQWRSKTYGDPENKFFIRSLAVINLSERWTSADKKTDVRLWVNNLTDKKYSLSIKLQDPAGVIGDYAPPRTYGITIGRKF